MNTASPLDVFLSQDRRVMILSQGDGFVEVLVLHVPLGCIPPKVAQSVVMTVSVVVASDKSFSRSPNKGE